MVRFEDEVRRRSQHTQSHAQGADSVGGRGEQRSNLHLQDGVPIALCERGFRLLSSALACWRWPCLNVLPSSAIERKYRDEIGTAVGEEPTDGCGFCSPFGFRAPRWRSMAEKNEGDEVLQTRLAKPGLGTYWASVKSNLFTLSRLLPRLLAAMSDQTPASSACEALSAAMLSVNEPLAATALACACAAWAICAVMPRGPRCTSSAFRLKAKIACLTKTCSLPRRF